MPVPYHAVGVEKAEPVSAQESHSCQTMNTRAYVMRPRMRTYTTYIRTDGRTDVYIIAPFGPLG